jgi:mannitol-specific phosphotransferase system IIBC component
LLGANVGAAVEGACEIVGLDDGSLEREGFELIVGAALVVGMKDILGWELGWCVGGKEGASVGATVAVGLWVGDDEGELVGFAEMVGVLDGACEIVGAILRVGAAVG